MSDGKTIDEVTSDGGNADGGSTITLSLPDITSSHAVPFSHGYPIAENGDRVDLVWSKLDSMKARQSMSLTLDGQVHNFEATVRRIEGQPENKFVEITINCGTQDHTITHENGGSENSGSVTCGDNAKATARTNIELPKWDDWYNNAEVEITFEGRSSAG